MIRVAIAGAAHPHVGYVLDELTHRPEFTVVAACEPDPAMRAAHLAGLDDTPLYDDAGTMFASEPVDVAVVAGVYAKRADVVVSALRAGAHVLADKPLCTSVTQLDRIEHELASRRRHVSLLLEKRTHPVTTRAAALVEDGTLGELALVASTGPHKLNRATRADWFFRPEHYGGIAADLPVHDIDLVLRFSAATSGTVAAYAGNARDPDLSGWADHVGILLRAGTVTATIDAHWLSPEAASLHGHYRMRLTGSLGTAELDWPHGTVTVATHDREQWSEHLGAASRPAAYFFDAIRDGRPPAVDTASSLLATRVALLADTSTKSAGRPIPWAARG